MHIFKAAQACRYGMLDPGNKDSNDLPLTIRAVFIVGPDKKLKLSLNYPASVGRNMDEIVRCIDALQLSAKHSIVSSHPSVLCWSYFAKPSICMFLLSCTAALLHPGHVSSLCKFWFAVTCTDIGAAQSLDVQCMDCRDSALSHWVPLSHAPHGIPFMASPAQHANNCIVQNKWHCCMFLPVQA